MHCVYLSIDREWCVKSWTRRALLIGSFIERSGRVIVRRDKQWDTMGEKRSGELERIHWSILPPLSSPSQAIVEHRKNRESYLSHSWKSLWRYYSLSRTWFSCTSHESHFDALLIVFAAEEKKIFIVQFNEYSWKVILNNIHPLSLSTTLLFSSAIKYLWTFAVNWMCLVRGSFQGSSSSRM